MKELADVLADQIPDATRLRTARVTSVSADTRKVTVLLDGTPVVVPRLLGWTPWSGDVVLLVGSNGFWYAIGSLTSQQSSGSVVPPPINPPDQPSTGTASFVAQDSGSRQGGAWRVDTANVIQGTGASGGRNDGLWFYGDQIKGTLTGATALGGRLYVPRISGGLAGAQTATIMRHDRNTKTGTPIWSGAVAGFATLIVNTGAWVNLAVAEVQALITNGGGLGLYASSPYFVANAVAGDRMSGTLQIDWKRGP